MLPARRRRLFHLAAPLALFAAAGTTPALAQDSDEPINFVFATQLGSGIYKAGDQMVQVYRIPGSYTVRPLEGHPFGVVLRFAGALGFYDFEVGDVLEGEIPTNVDTITAVTGVEFPLRPVPRWELSPLAEVGYGVAGSPRQSSWVFSAGAESRLRFVPRDWTLLLGNRLVWAGQSATTAALPDRFVKLDTLFDARSSMPWTWGGRPTDLGPFAAVYLYASGTGFLGYPALQESDASIAPGGQGHAAQFEVGFTHGPKERMTVWKIPVPRVGLSYRFGDEGASVRLVLGEPF